jgi:aminomethyltransferase
MKKDFIAKDIILAAKEKGPAQKLVGFKMIDRGIPRHDYEIADADGNIIGKVTSGTQSPVLQQGIGLGYVSTSFSKVGTEIFIPLRGKLLKAEVVKLPFV